MKLVKKALAGLAVAAAATSSFGALNNISGIVWDPNDIFDFNANGIFLQFFNTSGPGTPNVGDILSGYGTVSTINGVGSSTFCQAGPNCALTFTFTGFELTSGTGNTFPKTFKDGSINFYLDTDAAADNSVAAASDGLLWLGLNARNRTSGNSLTANLDPDTGELGGSAFLDVVGGLAALAFNTNSKGFAANGTAGSDLFYSATFDGTDITSLGSVTLTGNTIEVPEPGSLALLGLGLVGLAAARRRKAA